MRKLKYLLVLGCFLFSYFSESAETITNNKTVLIQQPQWEQFLDSVKEIHKKGLLDGEILIAQGDHILLHLINDDIKALDEPQFMIGSVSKQFFAAALLKALYDSSLELTEEAKIRDVKAKLHLPISHFLPRNSEIWSGEMPAWVDLVTTHNLLTHTSGIANYTQSPQLSLCEVPVSSATLITLIKDIPLSFKPGEKYSYCNTGFLLVADIIEAITQEDVSTFIQEQFFIPLELSSTLNPSVGRWNQLVQQEKCSKLTSEWCYDITTDDQKQIYTPQYFGDMSVVKGAGSIISTAKDLLKWNLALHKTKKVLTEPLYELLISPNLRNYGYGIINQEQECGALFGHEGSIETYRTLLVYMPESDLSVILLCHISEDSYRVDKVFRELITSLEKDIPDEKERIDAAIEILMEKYPSQRGFNLVSRLFGNALKPPGAH